MTWIADPSRSFGIGRLSPIDIAKLKSAYGCSDRNVPDCFINIIAGEPPTVGTLSVANSTYRGCIVTISAPVGRSLEVWTESFMVSK